MYCTGYLSALLPVEWLRYFEVEEIREGEMEWKIILKEKEGCVPLSLKETGKEIVLNGYMNPVEVHDFPLRGKPASIIFLRRRWKEKGGGKESHWNEYNFHLKGMKATKEFGDFLKEFDRREAHLFFSDFSFHTDTRREDTPLV